MLKGSAIFPSFPPFLRVELKWMTIVLGFSKVIVKQVFLADAISLLWDVLLAQSPRDLSANQSANCFRKPRTLENTVIF
jgi:hypothetical protein